LHFDININPETGATIMPFVVSTSGSAGPVTFNGFSRWTGKSDRIAVVTFEGEAEVYDIDDNVHPDIVTAEIGRMYRADYDRLPEKISQYQIAD
jgi:hypothetical protein